MVKIITIGLKVRQFKERKRINLIINQNQFLKDGHLALCFIKNYNLLNQDTKIWFFPYKTTFFKKKLNN
jgi:hypothetical protein